MFGIRFLPGRMQDQSRLYLRVMVIEKKRSFLTYWVKWISGSLLLLVASTSCIGQNNASESTTVAGGQSKLVKTQGTNEYANVCFGMMDRTANLWFGTTGEGAYLFDGESFTNTTEKDGLCDNVVSSIVEAKSGILWFGTDKGVCQYDGKSFTLLPIPGSDKLNISVFCMTQDKTGNIWIGTENFGLYRYDPVEASFTHFLSGEVIRSILEDKAGNIWVGSWSNGGAYRLDAGRANHICIANSCKHDLQIPQDLKTHQQEIDKSFINITSDLTDNMISTIYEDRSGNIWFGTRNQGACRYDGKSYINFTEKEQFNHHTVNCILEDKTGNIWFGTESDSRIKGLTGGAWRFDGKSYTHFTTKEGLCNNSVFSMVEDPSGNIWFGTRGMHLCRYDGNRITSFSK